ncbi:MAG: hypothetical protein ACI8RD_004949 [Bacillariaceae sp.]|jgi:hypothetical protein
MGGNLSECLIWSSVGNFSVRCDCSHTVPVRDRKLSDGSAANDLNGGYAPWWLQHNIPIWKWVENNYKQVWDVPVFSSAGRKIFPRHIIDGLKNGRRKT